MTNQPAIIMCSSTLHNWQHSNLKCRGDMSLIPWKTWYRYVDAQLRGGLEHETLHANATMYARRAKVANDMMRKQTNWFT